MLVVPVMPTVSRTNRALAGKCCAGILEQHPQVRMSARKELHYFDQIPASPSTNGAENYAYHFAR